ncbi:MAG: hypothetical protein HN793_03200 [Rhodospirillaceae bacterium]|jgi:hypothetical protein|nr:hypothetical protein [Rhodospirillaceae bacterium]MBT5565692.1 hypothetical protein [Rhodospirillaceae bacterium]MBT6088207.1 hypothetical protein [Rhodospirillaceae bacterium]MBT6961954.1 hypothetical protein [Rhodospirillaceae bacterium]MBT7449812.1 hypothetical protein [Rhodospirillaceae bacterium]
MVHGFAKSVVSALTALSLAVALMTSVFAQSHAANAGAVSAADPCVDHHVPQVTSLWDDACATLCDTSDFHSFLGASTDRSFGADQQTAVVSYEQPTVLGPIRASTIGAVHSHDPPGSGLYLTTQRLRL